MTSVLRYSAFASTPEGGNPAGIVLAASGLSDAEMQTIAADVGYAETAFLTEPAIDGDARHPRVRYFSPVAEVPFCGHATVATAVALARRDGLGTVVFETPVGPISIETTRDGDGDGDGDGTGAGDQIRAAFTSVEPRLGGLADEVLGTLLDLLGIEAADLDPRFPPQLSFAGNWHPVLVFADRERFDTFDYDADAVRALMDAQAWTGTVITLFSIAPDEFEARNIFPVGTMNEDPATGSAAASVGGYLRALGLAPDRLVIHQGAHVGRPSLLTVDIPASGGIVVSGTATQIS